MNRQGRYFGNGQYERACGCLLGYVRSLLFLDNLLAAGRGFCDSWAGPFNARCWGCDMFFLTTSLRPVLDFATPGSASLLRGAGDVLRFLNSMLGRLVTYGPVFICGPHTAISNMLNGECRHRSNCGRTCRPTKRTLT